MLSTESRFILIFELSLLNASLLTFVNCMPRNSKLEQCCAILSMIISITRRQHLISRYLKFLHERTILQIVVLEASEAPISRCSSFGQKLAILQDRKSTRLNSSHDQISYAVF